MSITQPPPTFTFTLNDLGRSLFKHRLWAATVGLSVAGAVLAGTLSTVPLYRAEAALSVDRDRKTMSFSTDNGNSDQVEYGRLNTYRDELLSWPVLKRALETCELSKLTPYATSADPTETLASRIKVLTSRDSWTIHVNLLHESPAIAEQALNTLLQVFLERQRGHQQTRSAGALDFLSKQVADARTKLEDARTHETRFRSDKGILSTDPENNFLALTLRKMVADRAELDNRLAEAQAILNEITSVEARAGDDPMKTAIAMLEVPQIATNTVVIEQMTKLADLESQNRVISEKYKAGHPRAIEQSEAITAAQQQLAQAVMQAKAGARIEVNQAHTSIGLMDQRITQEKALLGAYCDHLIELKVLNDEYHSRETLYHQLLARFMEEDVTSRQDSSPLLVIEPARAGVKPVNIKRPIFITAAVLSGLVAAAITSLLREIFTRKSLRIEDHHEPLCGQPILG
jgi:uncharacterized protein involved in exopolysaccharide biosynthesis